MRKQESRLLKMRHSAEHVLMQAMQKLGYRFLMALGPATNEGFYFDFELIAGSISEDDFPKIEAEMKKIIAEDWSFVREERPIKELQQLFADNPYKQEWLDEIKNEQKQTTASIYWTVQEGTKVDKLRAALLKGEKASADFFLDLCAGPHLSNSSQIGTIKLLSIAGAYWRGSEKNKMLTRIYGTAFESQKELNHFLWQQEETKKRDHRKIGQQLEIFSITDEVGPGLPLWLPNGTIIKDLLEAWAKETESELGYLRVRTPHITKKTLYEISGHLPYYSEEMYPPLTDEEGEVYYLKPMNCPHHHMIYKSRSRSYKELPLRLAEYGEVYRYEKSGELYGLMRVRFISQNDAHIYCILEQAKEEFEQVIKLHQYYYKTFGLNDFYMELALRDHKNKEKYHGDEAMWQKAEELTRAAMKDSGVSYVEREGEAAFYGPKVDFNIKAVTGRIFGASTNQLDLYMADRFNLKYIGQDGQEHTPVIIHRAPLGSSERLVGFLIEHFTGAFPVWLSPVQVIVIPVSDKTNFYAQKIYDQLKGEKMRAEIDLRGNTLNHKIREAQLKKIPYMLILGPQEEKAGKVSLRLRTEEERGQLPLDGFTAQLKEKVLTRSLDL